MFIPSLSKGSGLGKRFKGFERGEIIKRFAEGNKFRKRPGITIAHVNYQVVDRVTRFCIFYTCFHFHKSTKRNRLKKFSDLIIG